MKFPPLPNFIPRLLFLAACFLLVGCCPNTTVSFPSPNNVHPKSTTASWLPYPPIRVSPPLARLSCVSGSRVAYYWKLPPVFNSPTRPLLETASSPLLRALPPSLALLPLATLGLGLR
ncbi:hypothetical protein SOVF_092310 [Spinacia oleracea]|nr:hypothetical protein SOVF_092310 [Spinacia oleracea]